MTCDFTASTCVIVDAPEIVAVRHGRERTVERKDFETVARQVEFAHDLWSRQRDNERTNREFEPGKTLFGDGRAAEHVAPFEHENLLARAGQISRINQTV